MSSTILLPPRAQLCIRYCSNKHNKHTLSTTTTTTNTFYMGLKSKVQLVAAKASALRINLNIQAVV
jgi:hypothetical protein